MSSGSYNFSSEPQPRTIAPSREDVLSNLMYFCLCLSPRTAAVYACACAFLTHAPPFWPGSWCPGEPRKAKGLLGAVRSRLQTPATASARDSPSTACVCVRSHAMTCALVPAARGTPRAIAACSMTHAFHAHVVVLLLLAPTFRPLSRRAPPAPPFSRAVTLPRATLTFP